MHELTLYAPVPHPQHTQLLSILSGLSAMQPVPIHECHILFKPVRKPGFSAPKQVGGVQDVGVGKQQAQTGDLFYLKLVGDVGEGEGKGGGEDGGDGKGVVDEDGKDLVADSKGAMETPPSSIKWTMQFRDLPEVARQRQVTSRLIADTPITSGDPLKFMSALDYSHTATYFLRGHRFTHLSTLLLVYRIHSPTTPIPTQTEHLSIDYARTRLLDPSEAYILQASIKVQDGSKVETMTKGVNELLRLKETLKGCVELEMGDRLALDTRIR